MEAQNNNQLSGCQPVAQLNTEAVYFDETILKAVAVGIGDSVGEMVKAFCSGTSA